MREGKEEGDTGKVGKVKNKKKARTGRREKGKTVRASDICQVTTHTLFSENTDKLLFGLCPLVVIKVRSYCNNIT